MAAETKNMDKKIGKTIVLIVEDDEVLLRALYFAFHDADYTIATANDGETAIQMVSRLKPNVILLDLLLPKMNGFDVLQAVKSNPELKHIPVIILSNLGGNQDIERAKALGADDYFVKATTDLETLVQKIKKIV